MSITQPDTAIDSGQIDQASLALGGARLYWVNAGVARTYPRWAGIRDCRRRMSRAIGTVSEG